MDSHPASGKITSFVIEQGLFFPQELTVPIELVENVMENRVRLKVNKDKLLANPPNDETDSHTTYPRG